MDLFEKCYRRSHIDDLREQDLFPYFRELQSRQDTEVIMEGRRRIMLGSNNYLGLTTQPEVMQGWTRCAATAPAAPAPACSTARWSST